MFLLEENQIAEAALPVADLRQHLRLGTGFAEDTLQDPVLGSFLRAAFAAIEGRTSRALITRRFVLTLRDWRDQDAQPLPIAPVEGVVSVDVIDAEDTATTVDAADFRLDRDAFAPVLRARRAFPAVPTGGRVEIRFDAGYGPDFADLPGDLRQAVLLLAAHYYEFRDETALSQGCMPFGVSSLIARYAPVRLGLRA
mgnify:CR=1 FL=1